jgi:DNA-binding PucR family transcriptional regulator
MRRLAQTLRVVLENQGSPRRAAHVLGVHENTVAKRLRAVEELLGDEVRDQPAQLLGALAILDIGVD